MIAPVQPALTHAHHKHTSKCRFTYRHKTARGVGRSDGHRRAAVKRFVVVHGHVRQHNDKGEDQLDGEPLPGAQRRIVRDGRLQIALVAGHGDTGSRDNGEIHHYRDGFERKN